MFFSFHCCLPPGAPATSTRTKWSRLSHSFSHHGLFGVHFFRGGWGHFLDDWGDVGGPVQLDLREAILVGLHHTLDPCNTHSDYFAACLSSRLHWPRQATVLVLTKVSAKIYQTLCRWWRSKVTRHFSFTQTTQTQNPSQQDKSTEAHFTHTDKCCFSLFLWVWNASCSIVTNLPALSVVFKSVCVHVSVYICWRKKNGGDRYRGRNAGLTARKRWEACRTDTGELFWSHDVWTWNCLWVKESGVFDSSPAHSGLSSSKFTAKSCETFIWGREHKTCYHHYKPDTQHNMSSPIYRLTDAFSFHGDQRQAVPPKEIQILSSQNSPCNCTCTRAEWSTLKSGGISAPKPNAGNILSLEKESGTCDSLNKRKA